jgi:hypothetical protein
VLALLNANTIGLSIRFHYPVDPICRGPDSPVRYERGGTDGSHSGVPVLAKITSHQAPWPGRCAIRQAAALFSAAEYRQAAVSEGVSAKRMSAKRVTPKRMSAKCMTPT